MDLRWLTWAQKIQATAQSGLAYSKDPYDIERFEELRALSVEIMSAYTGMPVQQVAGLFAGDRGYATPKVDIRAVVIKEGNILLVKENSDGCWSLPGGWADIGLAPGEIAVKEVKEESGYDVEARRLLAVLDRSRHPHPPHAQYIYKIFILCELIGGEAATSIETSGVGFFDPGRLPELSTDRITHSQIELLLKLAADPSLPAAFD
ncbi:NUDIX hydrolase [Paenibacillus hamazuiensis]|uniref:NUDIX hydrolase n=1 Tax=Paenibacillus hamazuiensis TaxID=2936508 RepID=UPI00200E138B|nr:NUDIX hydrolase [Paenibacillus hamazuiensis]